MDNIDKILDDLWNAHAASGYPMEIEYEEAKQALNKLLIEARIKELKKLVRQDRYTNRDSYATKQIYELNQQLKTLEEK